MPKKMYKAGKVWVAATLAIVGVMTGGAVVSADDNGDELGVVADEPVPQPDQVVVLQKDETTSASSASASADIPATSLSSVDTTSVASAGSDASSGSFSQLADSSTESLGSMASAGQALSSESTSVGTNNAGSVSSATTPEVSSATSQQSSAATEIVPSSVSSVTSASTTVSRRGLTREVTPSAQATHQSAAVVKKQVPKSTAQVVVSAKAAPQATKHATVSTAKVTVAKRAASTTAKPVTKKLVKPKPFTGYKKGVFYQNGKRATGYLSDGKHRYLFRNGVKQKGVQKFQGTYYMFNLRDGRMMRNTYTASQWGLWYLFGADGRILTDVQPWAGGYYTFDARTYLKHTNVYEPARWGTWYMYDETGRCVSGYKYWQNGLYYFHPGTYLKATNEAVWENGNEYWADGGGVVRTGNWQIEHAIDTGTSLVGHSPYVWGGGRNSWSIAARQFDCSSFVRWCFANSGVFAGNVGDAVTYSQTSLGQGVPWSNIRRGDIFFMDHIGHVGIYLGGQYFLHDSPSSPTGGVGVSRLSDVVDRDDRAYAVPWYDIVDGVVRRLV
ncbi:NlpC/P60 family protein [Weissella cibaria]|uniref:NlpC/P60 family protein n=1 Tax=Weissella cibaria TaxID=137591 RepID=UPI00255708FF|nr:NlpC/P60 family protein [Weissella cibaria]MDK9677043.1 NlpC/P60 family protein [Weissella cibaria]